MSFNSILKHAAVIKKIKYFLQLLRNGIVYLRKTVSDSEF